MADDIFIIHDNGTLVEMHQQEYDSEALLQGLLADYPKLLAGGQIDTVSPRKWLLIKREMGIPAEEDAADRWSVDHLFLDQDAIPTLVEVKRSSDTRIRREVVGQMLDYAANAVVYWPMEQLRREFEKNCDDPEATLAEFLGENANPEEFWEKAKGNLRDGKIRMLFVADVIPNELRRIIEFLNEQMAPAEVLGVEIKQYVGEGMKTLVPRVIGQTAEAEGRKGSGRQVRQWDETSFFRALEERHEPVVVQAARTIWKKIEPQAKRIWWGKGQNDGSVYPMFDDAEAKGYLISLWTHGKVEIPFGRMKNSLPFSDDALRRELLDRLNQVPGVAISADSVDQWPRIPLTALTNETVMAQFLTVIDWAVNEIKRSREAAKE